MIAKPANVLWLRLNVPKAPSNEELVCTIIPAKQSRAVIAALLLKTNEAPSMTRQPSIVLLKLISPSALTWEPRIKMEVETVLSIVSPSMRAAELKIRTPRTEELKTLMLWSVTLEPRSAPTQYSSCELSLHVKPSRRIRLALVNSMPPANVAVASLPRIAMPSRDI